MQVYTQSVTLAAGHSMGGHEGERRSAWPSDELEVNGLGFIDSATGDAVELCCIDALYAGDLKKTPIEPSVRRLFAASHTHYAPMLDSTKPRLGALAGTALNAFVQAIHRADRISVAPDRCRIYRAAVPIPVYRRFDAPDSRLNRLLTRWGGLYPNEHQYIDRNIYLFEFAHGDTTDFVIALHACHAVSRRDLNRVSSDYIGVIRQAVRERFGSKPCLFLLGCAGDVRPNFARKRVVWLPRSRYNWRFEWPVTATSETAADYAYASAVRAAALWQTLTLTKSAIRIEHRPLELRSQGSFDIPCIVVADRLRFEFFPFEVSHLFHLQAQQENPMRFIVSCADQTIGYLPHPRQLAAGGYEVDSSRDYMGLAQRVVLKDSATW